ncbi:MAG: 1-deoxy-D-xylulose-5-phosphate reductoisomerase [Lachnospiraceae bacterium]|nr:1-deoxy-D-xylulose-5-phosphate reductoisomerase [Lachnospiraceae bacterium]
MQMIALLGSTGSIGTQTLEVVRENDDMQIVSMSAGKNIALFEKQIREFKPKMVSVQTEELAKELRIKIQDLNIPVYSGKEGLIQVAVCESATIVVTAIMGMIGITPTIAAICEGKDIALANKETLVTAGHIIMPLAQEKGVKIYPVDSEHSAIFQCLNGEEKHSVSKIILTASGGPFRGKTLEELKYVTLQQALKHPNWSMGKKITIDSATMVNKGLEVIEARWLFDVDYDQIQVVIQPQSIIHSMVEFKDHGVIAQLGTPDMKLPIQYALCETQRRFLSEERLNFWDIPSITFEKPDFEVFRGLSLAYEVGRKGGSATTAYNAANELAVAKFLKEEISFLEIYDMIEECILKHPFVEHPTIEDILETEKWIYEYIESR